MSISTNPRMAFARRAKRMRAVPIACTGILAFAISAPAAFAQETTTYRYDTLGRLTGSDARGNSGVGYAIDYSFDKASNRTRVTATSVKYSTFLEPDGKLLPGESILSADGAYRLTLQFDGNIILYDRNTTAIWTSGTQGTTPGELVMQADGNLVLYSPTPQPIWASGTQGHPGARLAVQTDGNLVIYDASNGPAIWTR
jgi:hypothetical protein